jgi:hypothetical protein
VKTGRLMSNVVIVVVALLTLSGKTNDWRPWSWT